MDIERDTSLDELYEGLEKVLNRDKFGEESRAVNEAAFNKVYEQTASKEMSWERVIGASQEIYRSEVLTIAYSGEEVKIPVYLFSSVSGHDGLVSKYLTLGSLKSDASRCGEDVKILREDLGIETRK